MKTLKTIIITAALALGVLACSPTSETKIDGIAQVVTETGTGSSFQIRPGVWLTAAHVVGQAQTVKLKLRDGSEVTAEVKFSDRFRDVAMLVAPKNMAIEVLPLACVVPQIGDPVLHRGHPLGLPYGEYFGRISTKPFLATDRINYWPEMQITSITAAPGSSGGILQQRGFAVGMVVGQFTAAPTMMITLTGKYLCDVLKWHENPEITNPGAVNG